MGFKIPLSTLFRAPTIAELAQHLINAGNSQEYAFETMLPIKSKGSRSPLFCIHPGMGMGWCFIGLLKHLDGEQPLYAVQQRGFFDNELPAESIQEMVSDYIDQIRQIQPHGPYSLLGFSFGGLVAHAMAVQLEEQGEEIALLVNMDASATMGQVALKTIEQYKDEIDMGQYFGTSSEVPELAKSFWEGGLKASHWNARLASDHSLGRYHGDMVLFRALKPQRGMDSPVSFHEWEQFVLGKIEVHDCVCTHDDMVDQERWAEIGCVLAQKLK
ncbi:Alpha/Beta hydrolase protein [Mortierella sp. GBAus27b]|nr:Alpha/Beta hydrolase protein [Mortierella sp. GBAus27b]